jgi:hypothetical protein
MSNDTAALSTPREIDERLAELYQTGNTLSARIASLQDYVKSMAGAEYYYRGRQRVTNMTFPEAREILVAELANHPDDEYGYGRLSTSRSSSVGQARKTLADIETIGAQLAEVIQESSQLGKLYTGWSRFFVVTSSNGHIHSSMHCQTCRPTTTFGWLPSLSDKSEAEAIEHFGPAAESLCSVCFPDAPVANKDQNLTKSQVEALLAGKTPEAKKVSCPGSGQRMVEPSRTGYAYGNWGTCPHCGEHVALTTPHGPTIRKHSPKAA